MTSMVLQSVIVVMMTDTVVAPVWRPEGPVVVKETWMNGYSVVTLRASSMFPMRKQKVTTMMELERPLSKTVHIILRSSAPEAWRFERANRQML